MKPQYPASLESAFRILGACRASESPQQAETAAFGPVVRKMIEYLEQKPRKDRRAVVLDRACRKRRVDTLSGLPPGSLDQLIAHAIRRHPLAHDPTPQEEATGAPDPVAAALLALVAKAPEDRFEREQRSAFRRALWGPVLPELGREPNEPTEGSLVSELARLVDALRARGPQSVEDLFVILHNALLGLVYEARHAELVRDYEQQKRQTWTRHRLRQAAALQDAAREATLREPADAWARVRIAKDAPFGDGWSADGTLPLARLAQGPLGRGPAVSWHDERRELMGYLTGPLGIPEQPAAEASSRLLRIYLGVSIEDESLRRWWQRREERRKRHRNRLS